MTPDNDSQLGAIKIHKEVLCAIIQSAVAEIDGVRLMPYGLGGGILRVLGKKSFPGIKIRIHGNQEMSVDVKILADYGLNHRYDLISIALNSSFFNIYGLLKNFCNSFFHNRLILSCLSRKHFYDLVQIFVNFFSLLNRFFNIHRNKFI